jgi:hypothetical protein
MAADRKATPRQAPPLLARTQTSAAGAIDNLLGAVAQLCDDAARTLGEATGEAGSTPELGHNVSLKLHDAAQYLRRRDGNDIVDAGIGAARRHPRLFVSTSAAVAALGAYLLISAPQFGPQAQSPGRRKRQSQTSGTPAATRDGEAGG